MDYFSEGKEKLMMVNRMVVLSKFTSIKFLDTQGLTFRTHDETISNYFELLRLEDILEMKTWLQRDECK